MARKVVVVEPGGAVLALNEVLAADEKARHDRLLGSPELLPLEDLRLVGPMLWSAGRRAWPPELSTWSGWPAPGDVVLVEMKTGPQNPSGSPWPS